MLSNYLEVNINDYPMLTAIIPKDTKRYHHKIKPQNLTVDQIGLWIDNINSGKESPYIRSQDAVQNEGPIKVVVGSTYD